MSILSCERYYVVCNTCEIRFPENVWEFFNDKRGAALAIEQASGWKREGNFHFCPKCANVIERYLQFKEVKGEEDVS